MENIRPRLKFGNKIEEVKLRKRKSQLYLKKDESPLNNGWALICDIYSYGQKTWIEVMVTKLCCNDENEVGKLICDF